MVMEAPRAPRQGEIWLVALDPAQGSEIRNTRPCLIVSPDEMNPHIATVIIVPLTATARAYPTRVRVRSQRKAGQAALDQIRSVDKSRLVKRLGQVPGATANEVAAVLVDMFTRR
jgi:mRNA interferase MazF